MTRLRHARARAALRWFRIRVECFPFFCWASTFPCPNWVEKKRRSLSQKFWFRTTYMYLYLDGFGKPKLPSFVIVVLRDERYCNRLANRIKLFFKNKSEGDGIFSVLTVFFRLLQLFPSLLSLWFHKYPINRQIHTRSFEISAIIPSIFENCWDFTASSKSDESRLWSLNNFWSVGVTRKNSLERPQ